MTFEELLDQLRQLSTRTYSYILLGALFGPLILRMLGLKAIGRLVRPAALAVLLGGMYARQQAQRGSTGG
jgi:hypothetical protein